MLHLTGLTAVTIQSPEDIGGVLAALSRQIILGRSEQPIHKKIQYIGHQNAVKGALSVLENLSFWLQINGDIGEIKKLLPALCRLLDLKSWLTCRLSSYQQVRRGG